MKFKNLRKAGMITLFGFFSVYVFEKLGINSFNPFILFILYYLISWGVIKFDDFAFEK